jgi:hypothetical protein
VVQNNFFVIWLIFISGVSYLEEGWERGGLLGQDGWDRIDVSQKNRFLLTMSEERGNQANKKNIWESVSVRFHQKGSGSE